MTKENCLKCNGTGKLPIEIPGMAIVIGCDCSILQFNTKTDIPDIPSIIQSITAETVVIVNGDIESITLN